MRILEFAVTPTRSIYKAYASLLLILSISACANDKHKPLELEQHNHSLSGKIWDVNNQEFLDNQGAQQEKHGNGYRP